MTPRQKRNLTLAKQRRIDKATAAEMQFAAEESARRDRALAWLAELPYASAPLLGFRPVHV